MSQNSLPYLFKTVTNLKKGLIFAPSAICNNYQIATYGN